MKSFLSMLVLGLMSMTGVAATAAPAAAQERVVVRERGGAPHGPALSWTLAQPARVREALAPRTPRNRVPHRALPPLIRR